MILRPGGFLKSEMTKSQTRIVNQCMLTCICIYMFTCVRVYTCICIRVRGRMHMGVYIHVYIHMYVCACMYVYVWVFVWGEAEWCVRECSGSHVSTSILCTHACGKVLLIEHGRRAPQLKSSVYSEIILPEFCDWGRTFWILRFHV